ncbi:hypothetical protein AB0893_13880 [Micromonospora aurantiaca]|uniref:hypothetical protein n=1 Tax=Micromonospora aurantiaca (nom. illeg.) TaxID=47850 RepID=UPI0033B03806
MIDAACGCLVAGVSPSAGSQELIQWLEPTLDDVYDTLEYGEQTEADTDARVLAEARRLIAGHH